ncbi:MAG: fatty acid desaturase [Candidatus Tectomicrobia bacterium]
MTVSPFNYLRYSQDAYSLAYLAVNSGLMVYHWQIGPSVLLCLVGCLMAYGTGCILHCHADNPMWSKAILNKLTEFWIILLRGDGCYAWIPTHILNHHRYANRPGDYTLTYRFSGQNNLLGFLLYTLWGTAAYIGASVAYLVAQYRTRRARFWVLSAQLCAYCLFVGSLWVLDSEKCLYVILLPQAFGLVAMVGTGYMQHQHTDADSVYNHSRNFTGRLNNWMHFNHGYHAVHHMDSSLHWSEWPVAHRKIQDRIRPELNQNNLPWYVAKLFLLQHLFPSLRTVDFRQRRPSLSSENPTAMMHEEHYP